MARKQARRQGGNGTPAWAWLLAGLFVGALAYFGYLQYQTMTAKPDAQLPVPGDKAAKTDAPGQTEPPASGTADGDGVLDTDYSFYDVLPSQESSEEAAPDDAINAVVREAEKPAKPATPDAVTAEPVKDDNALYILQVASFERSADADDLKARIALSGEAARVEQAEVNGKTMYRVRTGPYTGAKAADAAKANLAGQGIASVRYKVK
jgi:cell division protein FtsN